MHIFASYTFEVAEERAFFPRVTSDDAVLFAESAR
jgi:hypothetical protein